MHETKKNTVKSIEIPVVNDNSSIKQVPNYISSEKLRTKLVSSSIIITYSAAAVGSTTILLIVPNFETISLFIFLVTLRFGLKIGFQMMLTTAIIFELFATTVYGFGGWVLIFKIIGYLFFILVAGVMYKKEIYKELINENNSINQKYLYSILFFFIGYSLTIVYDLITTLSIIVIFPSLSLIMVNLIAGIPFFIFHEVTNGLLFSLIPSIIVLIDKSSIYGNY
ncbi:MAG: hypothetical protein HeimC3_43150 [Candidatus Heimdallarchaeota archaeon LC_3]|nr:MAG: hypothetical protein HeimC3_43150 [Candidatus Heimdallarchaeota archaeon LC_3]